MSPYPTRIPPPAPAPVREPYIERCRCQATYERTDPPGPVYVAWAAVHDPHEEDAMAIIRFGCTRCGAQVVTRDAVEALAWDKSHDAVCTAAPTGDGPDAP